MKKLAFIILVSMVAVLITRADMIYFLVGPLPGAIDQSFVLPLSRPEDIEHARDIILRGSVVDGEPNRPMVNARIRAAGDGINRDFLIPSFPEWSWHIGEFLAFSDTSAEGQQFSPLGVELMAANWPAGYSQIVSFPLITVTKELGPMPLWMSVKPMPKGLVISWSGLGTNYVYTLETKLADSGEAWSAVEGAQHLKTHQSEIKTIGPLPRLYRVRAELENP